MCIEFESIYSDEGSRRFLRRRATIPQWIFCDIKFGSDTLLEDFDANLAEREDAMKGEREFFFLSTSWMGQAGLSSDGIYFAGGL